MARRIDADEKPKFAKGDVLYIGRATSLRDRVWSYFHGDILKSRSPWIAKMLPLIKTIDFRKTDSVLEAILLEADLIKQFQPPYNTDEKDDKSFNCVVITDEKFPRVLVVRKKDIDFLSLQTNHYKLQTIYGPFPNGFQLQTALKIIRRIFPYRDNKCLSAKIFAEQKLKRARPCFNRQLGLCPGVCTGEISKEQYAKTIRNIKLFFSGKKNQILKNARREMKVAAKAMKFERAGEIKKTIFALQHIQDIALLGSNAADERRLEHRLTQIKTPHLSSAIIREGIRVHPRLRVEAYDVAHLSGTNAVGTMVVLENGKVSKADYRKFKIRGGFGNNDTASLREIIERRFNHLEWPRPDLIVADGGQAQKFVIEDILKNRNLIIPVVAVTKNVHHRPEKILGDESLIKEHQSAVLMANSEAHRFANSFHRLRRHSSYLS